MRTSILGSEYFSRSPDAKDFLSLPPKSRWSLAGSDYKSVDDHIIFRFSQLTITILVKCSRFWLKILLNSDPTSNRVTLFVVF